MDYDYRNRTGAAAQMPVYGRTPSTSTPPSSYPHPMYAPPSQPHHTTGLYPRVSQHPINSLPVRNQPSFHHNSSHPPTIADGIGVRVAIKPEYRITPPPHLSPQIRDIPRSSFQFDFDVERKILAEAEKDNQNWAGLGLENVLTKMPERTSPVSSGDPIANKYIASGLNREAVTLAVANFGDNPTKVKEFADHYARLRDMGFSSNIAAEALLMFDNDTEKALAYLLNNSS